MNDLPEIERQEILQFVNKEIKQDTEILSLIDRITKAGYIDKADEKVLSFCRLAEIQLNAFKDSESKTALTELLYSLGRRKN